MMDQIAAYRPISSDAEYEAYKRYYQQQASTGYALMKSPRNLGGLIATAQPSHRYVAMPSNQYISSDLMRTVQPKAPFKLDIIYLFYIKIWTQVHVVPIFTKSDDNASRSQ
jgi:hypothetical protein